MKGGTYTKTLAKIQVRGIFCVRDIRRNVLPKLIWRFVWRHHAGTHLVELQHGGRKPTATAKFERWFNGKEVKLDEDNDNLKRLPHGWIVRSFSRGGSTGGARGARSPPPPPPPLFLEQTEARRAEKHFLKPLPPYLRVWMTIPPPPPPPPPPLSEGLDLPLFCLKYQLEGLNRSFSLTWPASMLIYWNKREHLHEKTVKLPGDFLGTPTWPPFHCFGTPIWPP